MFGNHRKGGSTELALMYWRRAAAGDVAKSPQMLRSDQPALRQPQPRVIRLFLERLDPMP